jgi:hypothetical protein
VSAELESGRNDGSARAAARAGGQVVHGRKATGGP